jgi:hypothetical protein
LEEEKATLEGMVESRDELLMEIARETGLDRTGEDAKDDEDADDGEEAPILHEVILADAEPEPRLYHALMRDYEESPPRMMEDLDDLDDDPNEGYSDMDEWFSKDGSNDRD